MGLAIPTIIGQGVEAYLRTVVTEPRDYTLERNYADWDLALENMDGLVLQEAEKLRVDVVVHTTECRVTRETRGMETYSVPVDVAVRKKFGDDSKEMSTGKLNVSAVDALVGMVYMIRKAFIDCRLVNHANATIDVTQQDGGISILSMSRRGALATDATVYGHFANALYRARKHLMFQAYLKITLNEKAVIGAVDKAAFKNLSHAGASIRKDVKSSFPPSGNVIKRRVLRKGRRRKKKFYRPSPPGSPPSLASTRLQRAIFYKADKRKVVVGPGFSKAGPVGMAHEFGGLYKGGKYPKRPFMAPAFKRALPRFAGIWNGSIGA